MRPITEEEYTRMQEQTESKFEGMSLISIKMFAKIAGGTTAGTHIFEWVETGFMCDVAMGRTDQQAEVPGGPFGYTMFSGIRDTVSINISLPFRYLRENQMTIQQSPHAAYNGDQIEFFTGTFGSIDAATVINPVAVSLYIVEYNGLRLSPQVSPIEFIPRSAPYIAADGYQLLADGTDVNWQFYYVDKPEWHKPGIITGSSRLGNRNLLGTRSWGNPASGDRYRSQPFRR